MRNLVGQIGFLLPLNRCCEWLCWALLHKPPPPLRWQPQRMSEPQGPKARYKTTNWTKYNEAIKARGLLTVWLDKDMQWYAPASGRRGRQRVFSDAAIQFCLSIKCLFGLALRQSLGLIQSLLHLAGLDWRVPDFSTISRRQKTLQVKVLVPSADIANVQNGQRADLRITGCPYPDFGTLPGRVVSIAPDAMAAAAIASGTILVTEVPTETPDLTEIETATAIAATAFGELPRLHHVVSPVIG